MEKIETIVSQPSKQSHPLLSSSLSGDSIFSFSLEDPRFVYALKENKLRELINQKRQIEEDIRTVQDEILRMEIGFPIKHFNDIGKIQSDLKNINLRE
ncbi:hypothetical protein RB653_000832 [Dictyostelium firmibasis]|uniref:Uncharacterized protein n=1 Tax=Dictyostelium firmibasis TaxID=79012 RepID=A0AAN7U3A7_9MYCE